MITIEIHEETATREDMANALERIAELLRDGYTSGIEPNWDSSGEEEPEEEEPMHDTEAEDNLIQAGRAQLKDMHRRYRDGDKGRQRQMVNDTLDTFMRGDVANAERREYITAEARQRIDNELSDYAADLQG